MAGQGKGVLPGTIPSTHLGVGTRTDGIGGCVLIDPGLEPAPIHIQVKAQYSTVRASRRTNIAEASVGPLGTGHRCATPKH